MRSARIWTITLWMAGRLPGLVDFSGTRVGPSLLGKLVLERWEQLGTVFPEVALDEYAVLPDRFRALLHAPVVAQVELALAWFRAAVAQEARLAELEAAAE